MPLVSDGGSLREFERRLRKLPEAQKSMARQIAPVCEKLANSTIEEQRSPFGEPWVATKTGVPAFLGSTTAGRILSRVVSDREVRTTVLYPLHFHQDGTHVVGRKRGASIKRGILSAYSGAVLKQMGLSGSAPRKRKDESDAAYQARVAKWEHAKGIRKEARAQAKGHAAAAFEEARAAGGVHDPARPLIPDEGDPIPPTWDTEITARARVVLSWYGVEVPR